MMCSVIKIDVVSLNINIIITVIIIIININGCILKIRCVFLDVRIYGLCF
jgi:hypothetical protein